MLATALCVLVPASDASAGRLLVTGHDWDLHCRFDSQCHYTQVGVDFVRGDSSKKVLVVSRPDFDLDVALDNAFGPGFPRRIVEPNTNEWQNLPLTTRRFSAILIGSDTSCGGCDLNSVGLVDSIGINSRKGAIRRYFNKGGGLMAGAGANHGDGNEPDDIFYNFAPIPVGGVAVTPPFCLTKVGIGLGFHDQSCPDASKHNGTENDINCCATHNSFQLPRPRSALKVAETDSQGFAETLIATGSIRGGKIVRELRLTGRPKQIPEDERTCFSFRVRSEGDPVKGATVRFGGERKQTNRRGKARICTKFADPGRERATARKRGFEKDRTAVRVFPREPSPCPSRAAARC